MSEEKVVESEAQTTQHTQNSFDNFMNTCGACKESLVGKEAKLLLCLHTFCRPCVLAATAQGIVMCPKCRQGSNVKEVIDNKLVSQEAPPSDSTASQSDEQQQSCTACDEATPATSYCVDCAEWLCDQCVQAHRRVRMTKDHTVELKENVVQSASSGSTHKAMFCSVHKHELLKLFCETCDQLTCRDCQLLEHKEHKYSFVHEAASQYKHFLQQLLQKITEKKNYIENAKALINKRNKEIGEREAKVANEIKQYMMAMIAEISKRGKKLVQDLNSVCSAKKAQLGQKNQEILGLAIKLDHCLKFTQFIINHGDNQALLHSKRLLVEQLRNTLRTRCEVPNPNHVVDIRFAFDSAFSKNVEKLGMVIVDKVPFRPPQTTTAGTLPPNFDKLTRDQKERLFSQMGRGQSRGATAPQQVRYPPVSSTNSNLVHSSNPNQPTIRTGGVYYPPAPPLTFNGKSAGMSAGQSMINLAQLQQQRMMQRQQANNMSQHNAAAQMASSHQQPSSTMYISPPQSRPPPIVIEPEPMTPPGQIYPQQTTPPLQVNRQTSRSPAMSDTGISGTDRTTPVDGQNHSRPSSSDSNKPSTTVKGELNFGQNSCSFSSAGSNMEPGEIKPASAQSAVAELNISTDPAAYFPDIRNENEAEHSTDAAANQLHTRQPRRQSEGSITPPLSNESVNPDLLFNVNEPITDQVMNNQPPIAGKDLSQQSSRSEDQSEDWCAVCHNGGDLLCCDKCPKVYHLQCHVPALNSSPSGTWQCNLCVQMESIIMEQPDNREELIPGTSKRKHGSVGLTDREMRVCERILLELYSHEKSIPFHEPVPKSVPNYYKIITHPMDFGRIRTKLNRQHFNHYQDLDAFVADVELVFSNCATYNAKESEVGQIGIEVRAFFQELLQKLVPFYEQRPVTPASIHSDHSDKPRNKRKRRPEDIRRIEDEPEEDTADGSPVHYS